MLIASINLNKRLGNPKARKRLEKWLYDNSIDLLLAQEPWNRGRKDAIPLQFFHDLGGSDGTHTWIHSKWKSPVLINHNDSWQEIHLNYFRLHNVYFSAYTPETRSRFFCELENEVSKEIDRPTLIMGDFNFAPTPEDGICGNRISDFNTPQERTAFESLLCKTKLLDSTHRRYTQDLIHYTIERRIKNEIIRFRCDLALISDYVFSDARISYDHSVRKGESSFTDHSATIADLPVDLPMTLNKTLDLFEGTQFDQDQKKWNYKPQKTAMARSEPSAVAKMIANTLLAKKGIKRILDHGCGRGADVQFYQDLGYEVDGWDPHKPFGFYKRPEGLYDLVISTFVLNVLPDPYERLKAIKDMLNFTQKGGLIVISTRSPETIAREARSKNWERHNDGYWSSGSRGTFQKGIGSEEIKTLLKRLGLDLYSNESDLPKMNGTATVMVQKNCEV